MIPTSLVSTTPANLAAKQIITQKPIVMVAVADPVGAGLIKSLSRPGGNITGVTNIAAELAGKRLEMLEIMKELLPTASKVAVLINLNDPNATLQTSYAADAATKLAIQLEPVLGIAAANDLEGAFETALRSGATAALRMVDPLESALRAQTVTIAAKSRLPVIYPFRQTVEAGGLISYGTSLPDQYRQAATFVHKLLKGATPGALPVEQPVKLELAVNLKTAKALGLEVPPTILARADVIE